MKRLYITSFCFTFFCFFSCQAQQDTTRKFNISYEIGTIPGFGDFLKLNEYEERMDSIHTKLNLEIDSIIIADTSLKGKEIPRQDFRNNRGRLTFLGTPDKGNDKYNDDENDFYKDIVNENENAVKDAPANAGMPVPCECFLEADTIFVRMVMGFFGGFGFNIDIMKNKFQSSFYEYIDNVKPYKSSLEDKEFSSMAMAKSKYQYLILNENPSFKQGQQISGLLDFTSKDYYVSSYDEKLEARSVEVKIYFTCKVKEGPMLYRR